MRVYLAKNALFHTYKAQHNIVIKNAYVVTTLNTQSKYIQVQASRVHVSL